VTIDLDLACEPDSVGRARDALSKLEGHVSGQRLGDLRLLVSELVTNAIRHAGMTPEDSIRLAVRVADDNVRVEVADNGRGFTPQSLPSDPRRPSGWGLYLVEELAQRWGVEPGPPTRVWFELATSSP
jgi:anti-sigma regulatory factor (Ser/Thr protein kinase)